MFSFRTTPLWDQPDVVLKTGKVGILCNQTAWHPETGEYIFETYYKKGNLVRVFMPEHGLFAELQDQQKLDNTDIYKDLEMPNCEFISLYGSSEDTLFAQKDKLEDLDALIIELQDVGCRYYTFNTTILNLFNTLKRFGLNISVYIVDRINPAGRQVEGTMLQKEYSSFIGIEGILHRHGLTIGEFSFLMYNELNAKFPLHIISYHAQMYNKNLLPWSIPPSPNFPGLFTAHFYSGQCLWEGTNISEGRGTTRPFEIFGSPFLDQIQHYNNEHNINNWNSESNPIFDPSVYIRWTKFIPVFHKYANKTCFGFQLHPLPGATYHSLAHNLRIIKFVHTNIHEFKFLEGVYEAGNNKSAIELLVGDSLILNYLKTDNIEWDQIKEHIKIEEQKWIRKTKKVLLYNEPLFRCK